MPRVSDDHRARRRRQILDAARRCFVRRGFHQTSMQDILREADLSAGAVYTYFRSKDEIVAAIAEEVIEHLWTLLNPLTTMRRPPPLPEVVATTMTAMEDLAFGEDGVAYIAPQVWAEALHNPRVHDIIKGRYGEMLDLFVRLVHAEQDAGHLDAAVDAQRVASVVFGSVLGYIVQRVLLGGVDPDGYAAGLAALGSQQTPNRAGGDDGTG